MCSLFCMINIVVKVTVVYKRKRNPRHVYLYNVFILKISPRGSPDCQDEWPAICGSIRERFLKETTGLNTAMQATNSFSRHHSKQLDDIIKLQSALPRRLVFWNASDTKSLWNIEIQKWSQTFIAQIVCDKFVCQSLYKEKTIFLCSEMSIIM